MLSLITFARAGDGPPDDNVSRGQKTILVEKNSVDLGILSASLDRLLLKFRWRNQSKQALDIADIKVSCRRCASVSASAQHVPGGGTVDLLANVGLKGLQGNLGVRFLVTFRGDLAQPQLFSASFYRPETPAPRTIAS